MEQAREGPRHVQHPGLHGPTFSWQTQTFNPPAAHGPLFKVGHVHIQHILLYIPLLYIYSPFAEYIIYFFPFLYIVYSTSRVPKLNTQHIHARWPPCQNPMHRVSKLQSLPLLRLHP